MSKIRSYILWGIPSKFPNPWLLCKQTKQKDQDIKALIQRLYIVSPDLPDKVISEEYWATEVKTTPEELLNHVKLIPEILGWVGDYAN
jgi:hypothetical protein